MKLMYEDQDAPPTDAEIQRAMVKRLNHSGFAGALAKLWTVSDLSNQSALKKVFMHHFVHFISEDK